MEGHARTWFTPKQKAELGLGWQWRDCSSATPEGFGSAAA
jgi:hypothetical protein